MFLVLKKVPKN